MITLPPVDRGIDAWEIARLAEKHFEQVAVETDPEAALLRAGQLAGADEEVLVTGSLYLVGHVLALIEGQTRSRPIAM